MYRTTVNNLKLKKNEEKCLWEMCHYSKNLYNQTLFEMNRYYKDTGKTLTAFSVRHILKTSPNKKKLPSHSASCVYRQVEAARKAFFETLKAYKRNPDKFESCPRPPRYLNKDGYNRVEFEPNHFRPRGNNTVALTVQKSLKKRHNIKELIVAVPKHIDFETLKLITVIPGKRLKIAFTYETFSEEKVFVDGTFLSIDLGVGNICACIDNVTNSPFLISGKPLKHILWKCNKDVAKLKRIVDKTEKVGGRGGRSTRQIKRIYEKRNNRVKHELHAISNYIIRHCVDHGIGMIIIGQNIGWKKESDMGKKTNQMFVQMPHSELIHYMEYKGGEYGINVVTTNESYTSKCDALSLEPIEKHVDDNEEDNYMGRRVKRGLYQSGSGKMINADINGAINIARRVLGEDINPWVLYLGNEVCNPQRVNLSQRSNREVSKETSECAVRFAPRSDKGGHASGGNSNVNLTQNPNPETGKIVTCVGKAG